MQSSGGNLLGMFNLFTGGALQNFAVGALGIMPYISASIIIQLMTAVIPQLEKLKREGESGQAKVTQYTRYLTLLLCCVQGYVMAATFENPQLFDVGRPIVLFPGLGFRLMAVLTLTCGTMLLMWLGEQITERGIGNGISLIITISIISSLPAAIGALVQMFTPVGGVAQYSYFHLVALLMTFFLVTAGTVAITQGTRRIPIQHAKRVVGRKTYGGQSTFMPLRVNYSGVMPIIFAQAILMFPQPFFNAMGTKFDMEWAFTAATLFDMNSKSYLLIYALMILFFSYFWVATQFNPINIADDLKRSGAYIPGIRPGRPTSEYLDRTMTRITLAGSLFLTGIAVIPFLMTSNYDVPFLVSSFFGGTSLLIMVGVMLDTMRQVESHLLTRHYDGFLKKGKLKSKR